MDSLNGIHVSGDITVNATVGNETSLTVRGYSNLLDQVETGSQPWGVLLLQLSPFVCNSNLVVDVVVPAPMHFAGAAAGGKIIADTLVGSITSSSHADVTVTELVAHGGAVFITASALASVNIARGHAGSMTVSASSRSSARFGDVTADSAVITASSQSSVSGLTVGSSLITASSQSDVALNATRSATYSCSSMSSINITGDADISRLFSVDCRIDTPVRGQGIVYP